MEWKIVKQLVLNSYKTKVNFKDTLSAITNIERYLINEFRKHYKLIEINGPILFNPKTEVNENNYFLSNPKCILFNKSKNLSELSTGIRKWSRILVTNLKLKWDEALLVKAKINNFDNYMTEVSAHSYNVLTLTIPLKQNNRNKDFFYQEVKWIHTLIRTLVVLGIKKYKVNKKIYKKNYKVVSINNLIFNSSTTFIKSLLSEFEHQNDSLLVTNIPENEQYKNYLFKYDVYSWNYFARLYVLHEYTTVPYDIFEISISPTKENILKQTASQELSEYRKSIFYKLVTNDKLKDVLQIQINLDKLFMCILNKYDISEVSSVGLDDERYNKLLKNRIKIL